MSGGVPPSSRAGRFRNARRTGIQKARDLYERFTGHDAEEIGVVKIPSLPKSAAVIGVCDGVLYTTVRDGVKEKYIHRFRAADRPLLAITPDGTQILLIGGRYKFTEKGIVDFTDKENWPDD